MNVLLQCRSTTACSEGANGLASRTAACILLENHLSQKNHIRHCISLGPPQYSQRVWGRPGERLSRKSIGPTYRDSFPFYIFWPDQSLLFMSTIAVHDDISWKWNTHSGKSSACWWRAINRTTTKILLPSSGGKKTLSFSWETFENQQHFHSAL